MRDTNIDIAICQALFCLIWGSFLRFNVQMTIYQKAVDVLWKILINYIVGLSLIPLLSGEVCRLPTLD